MYLTPQSFSISLPNNCTQSIAYVSFHKESNIMQFFQMSLRTSKWPDIFQYVLRNSISPEGLPISQMTNISRRTPSRPGGFQYASKDLNMPRRTPNILKDSKYPKSLKNTLEDFNSLSCLPTMFQFNSKFKGWGQK